MIDDPTPCINPLYYFASQVPKDAVDYHYTKRGGKWYFDSDSEFKYPISETIDQEFVHEFASWVDSTEVRGKISVVPYPAGLGRVDRKLGGFPRDSVKDFLSTIRTRVMQKFDVGSELLTHTRALNPKTGKLIGGVSEHDWSQRQNASTLGRYIGFSLEILKHAGLNPTGVTSPCNFGMYVEEEYVKAILEASRKVLDAKVVWYFLHVDSESYNVDHRVMYLNRGSGEAVVGLVGSMNDPFWTSQMTDLPYDSWTKERIDPVLAKDGTQGRIADQVISGSYVTIVTHWQSLYSNGSRYGLRGLSELVSRINSNLGDKIVWMGCSEIANYLACASSVSLRNRFDSNKKDSTIEILSPFVCKDFTISFETDSVPSRVLLHAEGDDGDAEATDSFRELEMVSRPELLKSFSWFASESGTEAKIFICLGGLSKREEKLVTYGVTKKTKRKIRKEEYSSRLSITY